MKDLQSSPIRGLTERRRVTAYNPYLPRVVNAVQRFGPRTTGKIEGNSSTKLPRRHSKPNAAPPSQGPLDDSKDTGAVRAGAEDTVEGPHSAMEEPIASLEGNKLFDKKDKLAGIAFPGEGRLGYRGLAKEYHWRRTTSQYLISVEDLPAPRGVGYVHIHVSPQSSQVWIGVPSTDSAGAPQVVWAEAGHGRRHPTMNEHFLSLRDPTMPSWIVAETLKAHTARMKEDGRI